MTTSNTPKLCPGERCFWCTQPAVGIIFRPICYWLPACGDHLHLDAKGAA